MSVYTFGVITSKQSNLSAGHEPNIGTYDALVVGDGLVGMTSALAASHAGLRTCLISRPPSQTVVSVDSEPWDKRVYAISPASRRFLEELRVWSQMDDSRIAAVHDMWVYEQDAGNARIHFGAYEANTEALAWIVEHREIARVLRAALQFQHGVELVSTEVQGFDADTSRVAVATSRGVLTGSLLVAADGAKSKIREFAGIQTSTRPYRETAVVANFQTDSPHRGVARQWFAREGVVALLPLPAEGLSLVWSAPDDEARSLLALTPDELALRVSAIAGSAVGSLRPLGTSVGYPLSLMQTARQIGTRIVLVGDAAHVIHPLAGQGLNLGLQDVAALTQILKSRESFRDCGDAVLLRRLERMRKEPVIAMQQVTNGLHALFSSDAASVVQLRRFGMRLVERVPGVKRALIRHAMG